MISFFLGVSDQSGPGSKGFAKIAHSLFYEFLLVR